MDEERPAGYGQQGVLPYLHQFAVYIRSLRDQQFFSCMFQI